MNPYALQIEDALRAALIFLRIAGILFALPVFGEESTPTRVRILLAGALTIGLWPVVPPTWVTKFPHEVLATVWLILRELFIGITLGFLAKLAFEGISMAANVVGFQMGFGTANLIMPELEAGSNSFTALHRSLMILIFLGLSLHHIFIKALVDSFALVPAGGFSLHGSLTNIIVQGTASVFVIAVQLSAPVLVTLLFTMAAMGILSRAVPQVNVFVMSFPASFFAGLIVYIATLPLFPGWIQNHFSANEIQLTQSLQAMLKK